MVLRRGLLKTRWPLGCRHLQEKHPHVPPHPSVLPQHCLLLHRAKTLQRGCPPPPGFLLRFWHVSQQWGPLRGEGESWGLLHQGDLPCFRLPASWEAPESPPGMLTALCLGKRVSCSLERWQGEGTWLSSFLARLEPGWVWRPPLAPHWGGAQGSLDFLPPGSLLAAPDQRSQGQELLVAHLPLPGSHSWAVS